MAQAQNTVSELLRWHRRAVVDGDLTVLLTQLDLDGAMEGGGTEADEDENGEQWGDWMVPYPKAVWLIRAACNHYPLPFTSTLLDAAMARLSSLPRWVTSQEPDAPAFVDDEPVRDLITEIMEHPDAFYH